MKQNENNTRIEKGINELRERYHAVQILPRLKEKYGERIGREILSVRMYQTSRACYLEICKEILILIPPVHRNINKYFDGRDFTVTRENISLFADGNTPLFTPVVPVEENAARFFEVFDGRIPESFDELFAF